MARARVYMEQGLSTPQVAARLSVNVNTLYTWLRGQRSRRDTSGLREEGVRLLEEEGLSREDVAERLGVGRNTIYRWCPPPPRLTAEQRAAKVREAKELLPYFGNSLNAVARHLGVSRHALKTWMGTE